MCVGVTGEEARIGKRSEFMKDLECKARGLYLVLKLIRNNGITRRREGAWFNVSLQRLTSLTM